MHLRITTIRRQGKTYRYAQLVESFRREDGVPAHRVLSSLGQLSELEIENLRTALAASRGGSHVVVREPVASKAPAGFVEANLRYLDLAVLLEVWREWGLDSMLDQLSATSKTEAAFPDVVASLVLHRVVDPGSKLHAQRWFPTTAVPEMTGVRCAQLNNSRIHRVLWELERMDEPFKRLRYRADEPAESGQPPRQTTAARALRRTRGKEDVARCSVGRRDRCSWTQTDIHGGPDSPASGAGG